VDPLSPYFAHLRLRENGAERDLCLGRATRIERGIRIVDWRNAPVSRIFYRYQQGDEYEEEFAGRAREGQVTARRTVRIRDGVLDRIEAPEGVFTAAQGSWRRTEVAPARLAGGEATALRAHAVDQGDERRLGTDLEGDRRRADKHLPEITSLIDPAQFGLITRSTSGFLVIRGSAGSGKTTVALHRIAYLAFDDPDVDSERTLFVVFSAGLRNYVGHVLPSLGVENVRIVASDRGRRGRPGAGAAPEASSRHRLGAGAAHRRDARPGHSGAGARRLGERAHARRAAARMHRPARARRLRSVGPAALHGPQSPSQRGALLVARR
jgi:DNA helicase-2/ATP-dependent DNA helicase PcrA